MDGMATRQDLEALKRSREGNLRDPYRVRGSGQAATLGHIVGAVSPAARDAVLSGTAQVHNLLDSADIGAGNLLNKAGIPDSWTRSAENINLGHLPPGKSGIYPVKRVFTHRASGPIGRLASIIGLGSLGLWAKKKFIDSQQQSPDISPMTRTASHGSLNGSTNVLTNSDVMHTVDAQKLASHVIEKQAALISELQTEHHRVAKYAAALAQAVRLARDGAIDLDDVEEHARQLIASGSVKMSAADDVFDQSPGDLQVNGRQSNDGEAKLDPLTKMLRSL
jgi:hypothetical protein